jgi:hypothetical protein
MTPYLLVDGTRVAPDAVENARIRFRLKLPAHEIRLISGAASPAELGGSSDDRRLGVLLRGMRWSRHARQNAEAIDVPVDSPAFIDGYHAVEIHEPGGGPVRWTTGDAALPPGLFPPWEGETELQLSLGEWRGSTHEAPPRAEAAVLSAFESLGEDCEFGFAQRTYLVEPPLSLLRWSAIRHEQLIRGLDSGFAGLGDPDRTELVWNGRDYAMRTPLLSTHTNCYVERDASGAAEILRVGRSTLRILRRKLLQDIADAARIFVFKSNAPELSETGMLRLHAALRRIGPASLLCVRAVPGQPIRVVRLADGLYAGTVPAFGMPHGPFDHGPLVCAETLRLHGHHGIAGLRIA